MRRVYLFENEGARALLYSQRVLASENYRKYESLLRARRNYNRKRVIKTLTFPLQLFRALTIKSGKFDMHYTEYLRYLIAKDVEAELRQLSIVEARIR
jgi:hypothetical protein